MEKDYYEVVIQRNERYIRFIKHDLSVALEAATAIIMKHVGMDQDVMVKPDMEIDIYRMSNRSCLLEVHIEV